MRKICVLALSFALPALLLSQSKESPQGKPVVFTHVTVDAPSRRCNSAALPAVFADKAFSHVVSLAASGVRSASTEGEWRAIGYVRDQFRKIGLKTVVEDFEFDSYEIEDMELRLGDSTYRPVSVVFNPYAGNYKV